MNLYLFRFRDSIPSNYKTALPVYFHVNNKTTYDVILIRLLTSTIDIIDNRDRKIIKLKKNYTTFPYFMVARKSGKQIKSSLSPFSFKDFARFSAKFYGRNLNFYFNLLQELTHYFVYTEKNQHQAAFVNLYRALEYISYSFPLIHASHFSNFNGSFEAFRSYFTDEKTSELKFFETFVTKLFQGTSYLTITTTFNFIYSDEVIANNCYDAFYSLLKPQEWASADGFNSTLEVENKFILRLLKNTRNKYFHFAIGGQRNLQNTDLKDPEVFFKCINEQFLNWMAFIFTTILKDNLDNVLL